jgi:hypothetical protein
MAQSNGPQGFEDWIAAVYDPEEVPNDELKAPTLRWLRGFFDAEGPAPAEQVSEAFLRYQVARAGEAAAAVEGDLQRTTPLRLVVTVARV